MKRLLLVLLLLLASGVHAQPSPRIVLACKGEVTETTDYKRVQTRHATFSLVLDTSGNTAQVNGWWGCMANYGQSGDEHSNEKSKCMGVLKLTATPGEYSYRAESDGDMFRGDVLLRINRASGSVESSSNAFSKPASGATWNTISSSTQAHCEAAQKLP